MSIRRPTLILPLLLAAVPLAAQEPLTLEQAVELAVTRNERVAAAETTVEAAQARLTRARSFFFPNLDVTGGYRNDSGADTRNSLSSTAILTQPLFNARAFPLLRATRYEHEATRLSATETRRVVAFDAADAFLVTLSFEQVLAAAEHRREFARASLQDSRARFEAGLVSSNDVTRAELELATAERAVAQASGDVQNARIQLGNLLNTEISGNLVTPVALLEAAATPPAESAENITAAQQRRNDIAAARFRLDALRALAEEPSRRFIPSLGLSAQTRNFNEGAISNRDNEGNVGLTFVWPLFDAGIRRAEEAERLAVAREAELELQLAVRDVERQMRGARVQLVSEQAALREAHAALRAARRNAEETNELYRQGLASALELADANQALFDAEVALATAQYRMARAYLSLKEARGDGVLD